MSWRLLYCLFNRHRPKSASVRWSGVFNFGECRSCGRMIRKSGRGYWKRLDGPVPEPQD
ncbi:MAG: hypothetical protein ACKVOL_12075 [Novosphingobium sp.]